MEILNPISALSNAQTAFTIQMGKQATLHAKGLAGDDKVYVEILELSKAPDFTGNPCCTFYRTDIQVIARTPLLCPDGRPVVLTADYPVGALDTPQNVTLGVRVEADDAAVVSIEMYETDSDDCLSCICDRPCEITTWVPTGQERCVDGNVEREEESNCGTKQWVVDRPQTWVHTGEFRCEGENVEAQEVNDCGTLRWVVDRPQTWTDTGAERCLDGNVEKEQKNDCCCETRWVVARAQTWTPTGQTRCENNLVENEERNDCGALRWAVTATICGYCPSLRISCDGQAGFGFHLLDPKDPAATVEMAPCDDDNSVDSVWIYPSAGPGHTVKVLNDSGVVVGYAANRSDCAPDCGCQDPVINVKVAAPSVSVRPENNVYTTTNVTLPAPSLMALRVADDGSVAATNSDGTVVTSNPLPSC